MDCLTLLNQMQAMMRSKDGGWHARAMGCGQYAWAENCEDAMRAAITLKPRATAPTYFAPPTKRQRTVIL